MLSDEERHGKLERLRGERAARTSDGVRRLEQADPNLLGLGQYEMVNHRSATRKRPGLSAASIAVGAQTDTQDAPDALSWSMSRVCDASGLVALDNIVRADGGGGAEQGDAAADMDATRDLVRLSYELQKTPTGALDAIAAITDEVRREERLSSAPRKKRDALPRVPDLRTDFSSLLSNVYLRWRCRQPRALVDFSLLRRLLDEAPSAPPAVKNASMGRTQVQARNVPKRERAYWNTLCRQCELPGEQPCAKMGDCRAYQLSSRLLGAKRDGFIARALESGCCALCECYEMTCAARLLLSDEPLRHDVRVLFYREIVGKPGEYTLQSVMMLPCDPGIAFVPYAEHHYSLEHKPVVEGGAPVPHLVRNYDRLPPPRPDNTVGFRTPFH